MKKYLFKRILFSLFSLIVVVGVVMTLIYGLLNREAIFATDGVWSKMQGNNRVIYEMNKYEKYNYLEYENFNDFLKNKYFEIEGDDYAENENYKAAKNSLKDSTSYANNADVKEFVALYESKGYEIQYYPIDKKTAACLLAVNEKSVFTRIWEYFTGLISFETKNDVKTDKPLERYIRWEWDPISNMPALVGSGTTHKYLIYFDDRFPYIHQNIIHLNLGVSYVTYRDSEITTVITNPRGEAIYSEQEYPAQIGTGNYQNLSYDFHTVTYNYGELSATDKSQFNDDYTLAQMKYGGLSMLENSFVIGIIATIISYLLGLPLGVLMARKKDKLVDKLGMAYIIFIMAVPSLAYIFLFASIGMNVFGLPYKYATAETKFLAYILPTISLALPSVGSLMKWMRRYMIDQMNSDYVKFARAEGLSEGEIFSKHISRNAMIYFVHGIPGSILGSLTGAIITERVYGVPGVGNLLTNAINSHDNGVITACTLFYTFLSIVSIILGDILLAKYDPRISFTEGGGR